MIRLRGVEGRNCILCMRHHQQQKQQRIQAPKSCKTSFKDHNEETGVPFMANVILFTSIILKTELNLNLNHIHCFPNVL